MTYDHDLETRHPWLYSTLLDELDVTVSFTPGEKCAIYRIAFPDADQKHLLIKGARPLKIKTINKHAISLEEPFKYTTRGIDRVTLSWPSTAMQSWWIRRGGLWRTPVSKPGQTVSASLWARMTPLQCNLSTPFPMSATNRPGAVYAFVTREGGVGVLQIMGVANEGTGVRFRYKLVRQSALKNPREPEQPQGEPD
jgi:hypothetical protein